MSSCNPFIHDKVYVVELCTPFHFYVGTTLLELYDRAEEHRSGKGGSKWVRMHGYKKIHYLGTVDTTRANSIEDDVTAFLMTWFGRENVRGGSHNNCRPDCFTGGWLGWLPKHLRSGNVSPLHARVMPHFPLELRRLINRFEAVSGFHHPDQLYANVFSQVA